MLLLLGLFVMSAVVVVFSDTVLTSVFTLVASLLLCSSLSTPSFLISLLSL